MKAIEGLARLFSEDAPAPATEWSGDSLSSFRHGMLILRLGMAIPLLPGLQRLLSLQLVHIRPEWQDAVGWASIGFCIAQIVCWLLCERSRAKWVAGLPYWQVWVDVVFVTTLVIARGDARGSVVFLYVVPLLAVSHLGPYLPWAAQAPAILCVALVTMWRVGTSESITVVMITRGSIFVAGSIILRMYRVVQLRDRRLAKERETKEAWAILNGSRCGIAVLHLNGSIRRWNEVQEQVFAPPEGKAKKEAGLPCYQVFHGQPRPCKWCALKWEPVLAADGTGREKCPDGKTEKHTIDTDSLTQKTREGSNWAISNQLRAGKDTSDRFHLYYIYFGPLEENGVVTGVVEAVAEITQAVLEMPFLLSPSDEKKGEQVPEGLPPIAVVRAADKVVIEMNRAKLRRCQIEGRPPRSKEDVLNLPCGESFGRPTKGPKCPDCMVDKARLGKPARGITHYPGKALVTAVPLSGPDGKVRAVFEFIDPIDELVAVEEGGRAFGEILHDDKELLAQGRRRLRDLANADRCVILELHGPRGIITIWSEDTPDKLSPRRIPARSVPLVEAMLKGKERQYQKVGDLSQEERLGPILKSVAVKLNLGPAVLMPVSTRQGDLLAIASIERFRGKPAFDDEKMVYCQLLANHLAVSLARARDLQRRERFIEAMRHTTDILGPEAALRTLLEKAIHVFPVDVTLAGYILREEQGSPHLLYVGGDGRRLRKSIESEPPFPVRDRTVPLQGRTQRVLESQRPITESVVNLEKELVLLESTRTVRVMPLVYHAERLLGCIVAESAEPNAQKAFPAPIEQMLALVASYAAVVCGRTELLKACMNTYEHELDVPLQGAISAIDQFMGNAGSPELGVIRDELVVHYEYLLAAKKVWGIMIGQSDPLKFEAVDLRKITRTIGELFRRRGFDEQLKLHTPEGIPEVQCDRVCIDTCMRELLENAFKFRKSGTTVGLSLSADKQQVHISVKNEGKLPQSAEGRGFEMFWRSPEHREIKGTGLGLWVVETLVSAHPGGTVRLQASGPTEVECVIALSLGVGRKVALQGEHHGKDDPSGRG